VWLPELLPLGQTAQGDRMFWITATSALIYAPDVRITGVRQPGPFDDMFWTKS